MNTRGRALPGVGVAFAAADAAHIQRPIRVRTRLQRDGPSEAATLIQADGGADAGHDFVSYFVGAAGAADKNVVDV
jgi:hypothetical protein